MNIDLNLSTLIPVHTNVEFIEPGVVRCTKTDKELPDENTYAKVNGLVFHNGVIEVDVNGGLLNDAPDYARGFIGIVFRTSEDDSEFESFYIRPTNGGRCEDPVRKKHGCQYYSYPGYTFSYFREFGIETYEAPVSTIELNKWSHIKAVISEDKADFFVDEQPVLHVDGLKHGAHARGSVGLYVDIGTDGRFRNLCIECAD